VDGGEQRAVRGVIDEISNVDPVTFEAWFQKHLGLIDHAKMEMWQSHY
jgi:hypothetical protein